MKKLCIDTNEKMIVFVIYNKQYSWYISYKDLWFLDFNIRAKFFKELGYEFPIEYIDPARKDLFVLDSNNAGVFLERIRDERVGINDLKRALLRDMNTEDDEWIFTYTPSLYVDFDNKKLYSLYSELIAFENYVPQGWKSDYLDFFKYIPKKYRYWENKNSVDLLQKFYKIFYTKDGHLKNETQLIEKLKADKKID